MSPTTDTRPAGSPRARLGFLYPGHAAEDDFERMAGILDLAVAVELVHTSVGEDAHRIDALLDLGGSARLLAGAAELGARGVDAVVWACTSGGFVFGWQGAHTQVSELAEALGIPASSTSFAFVHAARAAGLDQVAIAATYPQDVADAFADFLGHAGIQVVGVGASDVVTAAEAGTLEGDQVVAMATAADRPEAQGVLIPDTALHTVAVLSQLEDRLDKPVLTANQVTMWEALRLTGALAPRPGLGALFELTPAA